MKAEVRFAPRISQNIGEHSLFLEVNSPNLDTPILHLLCMQTKNEMLSRILGEVVLYIGKLKSVKYQLNGIYGLLLPEMP